jgi:YaiO family outer membrane protein
MEMESLNISYYQSPLPITIFLQGSFIIARRIRVIGTIGAYKDWNSYLYTFSSVTKGSNTPYLPEFRVDHDFNLKLGAKKKLILTIGANYVEYFSEHNDLIVSGGTTYYLGKWIFQYRYFHNQSDPGSVNSHSQLISMGYGEEGCQWTWLSYSFGNQAYLASYLVLPEEINRDSFEFTLKHRRWLGKNYGVFANSSYFELDEGYDKIGFGLGFFYEF